MTNDKHVSADTMAAALKGVDAMNDIVQNPLVATFIRYLRNADHVQDDMIAAAEDAAIKSVPTDAWDDSWRATCSIAQAASYAVHEIKAHDVFSDQGKPLFFLGLFGFNIDMLESWGKENQPTS